MDLRKHQVLLIGFDEADALRIVSMLGSFDFECHRVPWSDGISGFVSSREFDAILCSYPDEVEKLTAFLEVLRAEEAVSRHAGVVVLVDPDQLDHARRHLGLDVNRIAPLDGMGDALRDSVLSLLDVAQRFSVKAPVEVSAFFDSQPMRAYCHTENLSMSGMLVSCSTRFPVGAPFEFAISLPGEEHPIRGTAQVARFTDPGRERGVLGMGASFLTFSDSHRSRLRGILARHVH
jgi:hypothetical protein